MATSKKTIKLPGVGPVVEEAPVLKAFTSGNNSPHLYSKITIFLAASEEITTRYDSRSRKNVNDPHGASERLNEVFTDWSYDYGAIDWSMESELISEQQFKTATAAISASVT